jgi:hypothetical protein
VSVIVYVTRLLIYSSTHLPTRYSFNPFCACAHLLTHSLTHSFIRSGGCSSSRSPACSSVYSCQCTCIFSSHAPRRDTSLSDFLTKPPGCSCSFPSSPASCPSSLTSTGCLVSYVVLDVYHCVCIYDIVCAAVLLSMV